ncbi:juvenile hormone acid O-methyltransferase-like [Diabrotica undecimpunctata]|uniref:juvenile hormone acid O-methyltransferase-like n=1 Tax=Diabrotica undecimpunctata TaxID=50387 RepID=UPI003B63E4D9
MTSMVLAELYAKSCRVTVLHTSYLFHLYKPLFNFPNRPSILEYGFGDGTNWYNSVKSHLPQDLEEYVATDISHQMIDHAKATLEIPRMKFKQLDIGAENLSPTYQQRFNLIFSFFANHLVKNPKQMHKNIYNMLKPSGQTFQITLDPSPLDVIFHSLSIHPNWRNFGHKNVISPYYYLQNSEKDIQHHLIQAGFQDSFVRREVFDYIFENEQEWKGLYLSCNPIFPTIPEEKKEEYIRDFYDEIKKHVVTYNKIGGREFWSAKYSLSIISALK